MRVEQDSWVSHNTLSHKQPLILYVMSRSGVCTSKGLRILFTLPVSILEILREAWNKKGDGMRRGDGMIRGME